MNPFNTDPREAKIKALAQYQIYCAIPIIVTGVLPHGHAIDAQHARNAALFRVAVCVLGLLGVIGLELKKFALRKAIAADAAKLRSESPPPGVWPPPPSV